jgi:hypothetical protein
MTAENGVENVDGRPVRVSLREERKKELEEASQGSWPDMEERKKKKTSSFGKLAAI